jgi:membrane-associated protein
VLFVGGGYLFGNIPTVKSNFHIVIVAIIVISILPAVIEFLRARAAARATEQA